jgi:hypothetical protein
MALTALPRLGLAQLLTALQPPSGEVVLTVKGRIGVTNGEGMARLDRGQILALGTSELRTATPWTEGEQTFGGVLGTRLLEALGAAGTVLRMTALNDYKVDIPVAEVRAYPVLLALEVAGRPLSVRERGPIWVIYPWSAHPELDDRLHRQRAIWQVSEIIVE